MSQTHLRRDSLFTVVIPTRNRYPSLMRLLLSLNKQIAIPLEIIVVDASDHPVSVDASRFPRVSIRWLHTDPSVCRQRNIGIQCAQTEYVLLCDDDIVLPSNYLSSISSFLQEHAEANVVTGLWNDSPKFTPTDSAMSARGLIWSMIFQTSLWLDLDGWQAPFPVSLALKPAKWYYRRRGNDVSWAGWPITTQPGGEWFRASVYTLGSAVVSRKWLLDAPYDEILDSHGIGDHYGVVRQFAQEKPIFILGHLTVSHFPSRENRLPPDVSYLRRLLALHYFLSFDHRTTLLRKAWFVWSLFGNYLYFSITSKSELRKATAKALSLILLGDNPYVIARSQLGRLQNGRSHPEKLHSQFDIGDKRLSER